MKNWFDKWLPRPRCWAHIAVGIIMGGAWVFGIGPALVSVVICIMFVGYQYLQYKYSTRIRPEHRACAEEATDYKDDSYLDVRETAVTVSITLAVTIPIMATGW